MANVTVCAPTPFSGGDGGRPPLGVTGEGEMAFPGVAAVSRPPERSPERPPGEQPASTHKMTRKMIRTVVPTTWPMSYRNDYAV
jgi:hypothetical protein